MRSFASPHTHTDLGASRALGADRDAAARFGKRPTASGASSAFQPPRLDAARGLDGWTIFLLGALVAGIMGMMLGGALSI
ncbi:MAG TPA: hypothetical protein VIG84_13710 [Brevundimonas sp.]